MVKIQYQNSYTIGFSLSKPALKSPHQTTVHCKWIHCRMYTSQTSWRPHQKWGVGRRRNLERPAHHQPRLHRALTARWACLLVLLQSVNPPRWARTPILPPFSFGSYWETETSGDWLIWLVLHSPAVGLWESPSALSAAPYQLPHIWNGNNTVHVGTEMREWSTCLARVLCKLLLCLTRCTLMGLKSRAPEKWPRLPSREYAENSA